jgi:hypothetical protein
MKGVNFAVLILAVALAGCSSGLLGGGSRGPVAQNVPVGSQLTLPPDLQLPPPGAQAAAYQEPSPALDVGNDSIDGTPLVAAKPAAQQDVYAQYGISKLRPDGSKKEDWELRAELKAAIKKKKREANPNYGTIFNVGELFRD